MKLNRVGSFFRKAARVALLCLHILNKHNKMATTQDLFDSLPKSDDEETEVIEDCDTCSPYELEERFQHKFQLRDETAVSLKNDYILSLCMDSNCSRIAVGLSNASVQLFDINAARGLTSTHIDCIPTPSVDYDNSGDPINICGVRYLDETPNTLLVGTTNGLVRLFDLRSSKEEARFEHADNKDSNLPPCSKSITTFDRNANSRILCAGTEQNLGSVFLLFFDVRERKELGGYFESHQDDVTAVCFHEQNPDLLCTGATDGLINVFDIKETSEDDALLNTINTESSVHKLNWHKNVYEEDIISCTTHTSDFKSYKNLEGDEVASFERGTITDAICRKNEANFNLIDAHNLNDEDGIFLLAGTNHNKGEILRSVRIMNKNTLEPLVNFQKNKQIVRTSLYDKKQQILVTGGECGIVSIWTPGIEQSASGNATNLKAKTKLSSKKNTPY